MREALTGGCAAARRCGIAKGLGSAGLHHHHKNPPSLYEIGEKGG